MLYTVNNNSNNNNNNIIIIINVYLAFPHYMALHPDSELKLNYIS